MIVMAFLDTRLLHSPTLSNLIQLSTKRIQMMN